ncbi:MAG: YceI family protein [Candidatus Nomurabacteria bacterium]|nr:YceI family protein [Candidatus Nomurabacteria bacterium]
MKNNNTIMIGVVVLVLILGGVYISQTNKTEKIDELNSNVVSEQNVIEDSNGASGIQETSLKTLAIVSAESKATYEIDEVLRGIPTHVVGNSSSLMGSVVFDPTTNQIREAEVKVDASTFKTDIDARDGNVKKLVLKSDQSANQYITFKTTNIEGMSGEVGKEFPVKVTGDMIILGVSKSVMFEGKANLSADGSVMVNANTTLTYGDFGVSVPDFPFLANVSKTVKLTVQLVAR